MYSAALILFSCQNCLHCFEKMNTIWSSSTHIKLRQIILIVIIQQLPHAGFKIITKDVTDDFKAVKSNESFQKTNKCHGRIIHFELQFTSSHNEEIDMPLSRMFYIYTICLMFSYLQLFVGAQSRHFRHHL